MGIQRDAIHVNVVWYDEMCYTRERIKEFKCIVLGVSFERRNKKRNIDMGR